MYSLKLFRAEKFSDHRVGCSYISNRSSIDNCRVVCELKGLIIDKIKVTIAGEEMKPDKRVEVKGFSELLEVSKTNSISSCLLKCTFNTNEVEIVIDFDTEKVKIISSSRTIIEKIEDSLKQQ